MSEPIKGRYRVGVVGVGRQGTYFARACALNPATEVVAGANRGTETLELFSERFNVPGYTNFREMLRKERIDIVVAVLPVKPNPEVVIASARAGVKGILSEKPIVGNLKDLDRIVEECTANGVPYQSGNVDRNYPQFWAARDVIASGEIGEVRSVHLYQSIVQGGCNALSWMLMFALGQFIRGKSGKDADVEWVVGSVNGDPFSDNDEGLDGIGGYLKFTNGIEGQVHLKSSAKRGGEVVCSEGVFATDGRRLRFWKKADDGTRGPFIGMKEIEGLVPDIAEEERVFDDDGWAVPDERIRATVQSIVDAVDKGVEPRCSGEDQRRAFEITAALRESARRGHAPVRLPLEDRDQKMLPVPYRWNSKRDLYGDQWYRDEMKQHKKG